MMPGWNNLCGKVKALMKYIFKTKGSLALGWRSWHVQSHRCIREGSTLGKQEVIAGRLWDSLESRPCSNNNVPLFWGAWITPRSLRFGRCKHFGLQFQPCYPLPVCFTGVCGEGYAGWPLPESGPTLRVKFISLSFSRWEAVYWWCVWWVTGLDDAARILLLTYSLGAWRGNLVSCQLLPVRYLLASLLAYFKKPKPGFHFSPGGWCGMWKPPTCVV